MLSWTLNDALQECARNTYNAKTMIRSGSYSGKGLEYATRFLSGLNYAIGMVSREKMGVLSVENVTLDAQGTFFISSLTKTCLVVNQITLNNNTYDFKVDAKEQVTVDLLSNATVEVVYESLPDEMTMNDLDIVIPVDQRFVNPRILCQYANYQFLSEEGSEYDTARAQTWLGLFNDGFNKLVSVNKLPKKVKYSG